MEALLVTFKLVDKSGNVDDMLQSHDFSLCELPGYVDHSWLRRGCDLSLLAFFADRPATAGYLRSHLREALAAHPAWAGATGVEHFRVVPVEPRQIEADGAVMYRLVPTQFHIAELTRQPHLRVSDEPAKPMRPGPPYCETRQHRQATRLPQPTGRG